MSKLSTEKPLQKSKGTKMEELAIKNWKKIKKGRHYPLLFKLNQQPRKQQLHSKLKPMLLQLKLKKLNHSGEENSQEA